MTVAKDPRAARGRTSSAETRTSLERTPRSSHRTPANVFTFPPSTRGTSARTRSAFATSGSLGLHRSRQSVRDVVLECNGCAPSRLSLEPRAPDGGRGGPGFGLEAPRTVVTCGRCRRLLASSWRRRVAAPRHPWINAPSIPPISPRSHRTRPYLVGEHHPPTKQRRRRTGSATQLNFPPHLAQRTVSTPARVDLGQLALSPRPCHHAQLVHSRARRLTSQRHGHLEQTTISRAARGPLRGNGLSMRSWARHLRPTARPRQLHFVSGVAALRVQRTARPNIGEAGSPIRRASHRVHPLRHTNRPPG